MYSTKPSIIIAFHGCSIEDQQKFLNDPSYFKESTKSYDWLGHGMYFWEGKPLYQGTDFKEKNHLQVCVRNPNCIKGFFLPRELNTDWSSP